ncbi:unnamed protein product, partial [Protopolystoma xenopodis]
MVVTAGIPGCALPCHSAYFASLADRRFVTLWLGLWAVLCGLSSLATLLTFLADLTRFSYPERPIVYLSVCYLMIALGHLVRVGLGHEAVACESAYAVAHRLVSSSAISGTSGTSGTSGSSGPLGQGLMLVTMTDGLLNWTQEATSQSSAHLLVETPVKVLGYSLTGRPGCASVFLLTYYFTMAAGLWWVMLTLAWFLAAGMKWGGEAIAKYSQ